MNTNHNRIKVSDLETNQSNKILTTNSEGEIEFSEINNIKVDSYNGLDYSQEGKALDARQGKILNDKKIDKALGTSNANKLLGTDENGNLKLYSLPTFSAYPAPFLRDVSPISILPNSTQNLTFEGAFFTPDMTLIIVGQTVNYITFITDNLIKVNVTTGSAQGNFDVILNNGRVATFTDAILIVLGTVYNSIESEWVNKTNIDVSEIGSAKCIADNLIASAKWTRIIDVNKNFSIRFNLPLSPMSNSNIDSFISFNDIVTGENKFYFEDYGRGEGDLNRIYYGINGRQIGYFTTDRSKFFELKKIGNIVTASYHNAGILISTVSNTTTFSNNLEVAVYLKNSDVSQLKYIELAI